MWWLNNVDSRTETVETLIGFGRIDFKVKQIIDRTSCSGCVAVQYSATFSVINLFQMSRDCLDGRKGTSLNVDRVEKVP